MIGIIKLNPTRYLREELGRRTVLSMLFFSPFIHIHVDHFSSYIHPSYNLPVTGRFQLLILNNLHPSQSAISRTIPNQNQAYLNPIPIRIQHKRHILHPPIRQPLLPTHPLLLKPLTRPIQIIDRNRDVSEPLRLIVAVVVFEVLVFFRAVVPGEFEKALAVSDGVDAVDGGGGWGAVAEEVEVEARGGVLGGAHQGHAWWEG